MSWKPWRETHVWINGLSFECQVWHEDGHLVDDSGQYSQVEAALKWAADKVSDPECTDHKFQLVICQEIGNNGATEIGYYTEVLGISVLDKDKLRRAHMVVQALDGNQVREVKL